MEGLEGGGAGGTWPYMCQKPSDCNTWSYYWHEAGAEGFQTLGSQKAFGNKSHTNGNRKESV